MALIKCPECGREISDKAVSCPGCGYHLNPDDRMITCKYCDTKFSGYACPFCGTANNTEYRHPQSDTYYKYTPPAKKTPKENNSWYTKPVTIILSLMFFWPVGLYLMWNYANWNKAVKFTISCFFALEIIAAYFGSINNVTSMESTQEQKEIVNENVTSLNSEQLTVPTNIISSQKLYDIFSDPNVENRVPYENQVIGVVGVMEYKNGRKSTELTIQSGYYNIKCYCADGYSAESTISNKSVVLIYGTCVFDDDAYYIDDCYYVEKVSEDVLLSLMDNENIENEQNVVNEDTEIINYNSLSEEEYKDLCTELWYDDIFFSEENLDGKLVKLDLFVEEERFFKAESLYNSMAVDFINEFDLQRNFYYCGVQRENENSYVGGQISMYFPRDCGYSTSDMTEGDHLIVYGEIISYSRLTYDGYNSCSIIPRYIENNGQ